MNRISDFLPVSVHSALGISSVFAFGSILWFRYNSNQRRVCGGTIPTSYPWFFPFWDLVLLLGWHRLRFCEYVAARCRTSTKVLAWIPPFGNMLLTIHPDDHRVILQNESRLKLQNQFAPAFNNVFGMGNIIVQAFGKQHQFHRKVFGASFLPRALERYAPHMYKEFQSLWELHEKNASSACDNAGGVPLIVQEEVQRAQFRVMSKVLYGISAEHEAATFEELARDFKLLTRGAFSFEGSQVHKDGLEASKRALEILSERFETIYQARRAVAVNGQGPTKDGKINTSQPEIGSVMEFVADALIEETLVYDTPEKMMQDVKETLRFFLEAAHSTTMYTTTALLYLLHHPDNARVRGIVKTEVQSVLDSSSSSSSPAFSQLKSDMPYTEACIKETLRLFPFAGGVNTCSPTENEKIVFPDGSYVKTPLSLSMIDASWMEDPNAFPDPDRFIPERWLSSSSSKSVSSSVYSEYKVSDFSRQLFKPFGYGRHVCLGQQMALLTLKLQMIAFFSNPRRSLRYNPDQVGIEPCNVPIKQIQSGFPATLVLSQLE